MRNSGCVPGHSSSAAFHQSRGRGALLLVSVSPYAHLLEQTTGRLPTGSNTHTHTITFAHTRLHVDLWESERATCASAQANEWSHLQSHGHKHTYTLSDIDVAQAHNHTISTERHILHVLHWVTFITFSRWSFFGLSISLHVGTQAEGLHYTQEKNAIPWCGSLVPFYTVL